MRRKFLALIAIAIYFSFSSPTSAFTSVWCVVHQKDSPCVSAWASRADDADIKASQACDRLSQGVCQRVASPFEHQCISVSNAEDHPLVFGLGGTPDGARFQAHCPIGLTCYMNFETCDTDPPQSQFTVYIVQSTPLILLLIFIAISVIAFIARATIVNLVVHGNLPRTLPIYADDIEVLFKRSQRVNWYGRIVFGVTARLGMTEKQLMLVRRYWLGRVIAFDSLRRQRQNELARMHLQLAASIKPEPRDKKALSQFLAFAKTIFLSVFYLLRGLFSFLFGFLFIRITIAKLARGKLIESKDLVLVLQAKEAIEETARYLKEYLTVAETFDGREELFESK
jgi:hypothetical protein